MYLYESHLGVIISQKMKYLMRICIVRLAGILTNTYVLELRKKLFQVFIGSYVILYTLTMQLEKHLEKSH